MKQFFLLIVFLGFLNASHAQVMQAKAQWATITVPQLKCWECKTRLEQYLLRTQGNNGDAGIIQWKIQMNIGKLRIQYFPDRINLSTIYTSINNAGFDADTTKATEDSYKLLPPICKRAEEGGGPQKGKPCNLPPEDRVSMVTSPSRQ